MAAASGRVGVEERAFGSKILQCALVPFLGLSSARSVALAMKIFKISDEQKRQLMTCDEWYGFVQRTPEGERGAPGLPDEVLFLYGTPDQREALLRDRPVEYLTQCVQYWRRGMYVDQVDFMPIFAGLDEATQQAVFLRADMWTGLTILRRPAAERQHINPQVVVQWFERGPDTGSGELAFDESGVVFGGALIRALPAEYHGEMMGRFAPRNQEIIRELYPELAGVAPREAGPLSERAATVAAEKEARLDRLYQGLHDLTISSREFRREVGPHLPQKRFFAVLDEPTRAYYDDILRRSQRSQIWRVCGERVAQSLGVPAAVGRLAVPMMVVGIVVALTELIFQAISLTAD